VVIKTKLAVVNSSTSKILIRNKMVIFGGTEECLGIQGEVPQLGACVFQHLNGGDPFCRNVGNIGNIFFHPFVCCNYFHCSKC